MNKNQFPNLFPQIVINEDGVNSLLLVAASRHDSGTYTCVAKNRGGEDTFTVNVTVLG